MWANRKSRVDYDRSQRDASANLAIASKYLNSEPIVKKAPLSIVSRANYIEPFQL